MLISQHLEKQAAQRIVPVFPPSALASGSGGAQSGSENVTAAAAGQLFLDRLRDVWDDHMACMSKLRDVLKYMVR